MARYIIDTSVVFEAFIDEELREDIRMSNVNLIAPSKIEIELANQMADIKSKAGLNSTRFNTIWLQLLQKIAIRNVDHSNINQAERILRDVKNLNLKVGLEDRHFFA